jgi:hypothetical protein
MVVMRLVMKEKSGNFKHVTHRNTIRYVESVGTDV